MATIYKVDCPNRKPLFEGVQGENEARSIQFDITPWVDELGDGAVTATAKRPQDSQPYPVTVTKVGNIVTWKPTSTDTAYEGVGSFQLEYTVGGVIAKTCIWSTMVAPSLDPAGDPPDPYYNYLAEMRQVAAEALQSAQDADESADDAQAEVYEAEAWAKGTKNGTPVSSSDAQYQNNSKYWAELNAGDHAELIDARIGADGTTYANAGDAVRGQVGDLKVGFNNMSDGILSDDYHKVTPYATANGWKLTSTGVSAPDTGYKLVKYTVTAGIDISVWCFDKTVKMQFQNDASVPFDSNPYIIGDAINDGYCGKLSVPIGARYIIMSVRDTDALSGVYFDSTSLKNLTDDAVSNQLKNYSFYDKYYIDVPLESGGLNEGINGAIVDNPLRLRSADFLHAITNDLRVELPSNLQWFVLEYDDTFRQRQTSPSWITNDHWTLSFPYFKIVIRKSDNSAITVADASDFKMYSFFEKETEVLPSMFILEKSIANAIGADYKLKDNGASAYDADYDLVKFAVNASSEIFVSSNHVFQFQNSAYVPSDSNPYIVGETVTDEYFGKVTVPTGATYLIMSIAKTDTESGVYDIKTYKPNNNLTMSVNPVLLTERYIGHRGGGKTAPENTIASCEQGFENGFKIVEVDVQFTSDNIPVVLHDTTINRTGRNADGTTIGSTINISDITYEDSQDYDFGIWKGSEYADTKLPKLDDVLLWAKSHGCCVECDLYGTENMTEAKAEILYDLITNRGMNGSVMFTASYTTTLQLFGEKNDICVCCSNVGQTESYMQEASTFLQKSMYTMCSVQYPYLTDEQVGFVHKHGMAAKGFTITSNAEANSVWANGVDKMILDGIYPNEITS